ncbi:hypothetical protein IAU59_000764 [Kwoniella sp. CBS 9459]
MSDSGREDDLFGGSEAGSDAGAAADHGEERQPSPIASSSKAASPAPASPSAPLPAREDGDDEVAAGDLFGDDDEEDEQRERRRSTTRTSRSRSRSGSANPLEYPEEEDVEVERHEQSWATLPLPQWPHMRATDDKIWHLKLPAYVNIESKPYDPDLYRESLDEEAIDGAADPIGAKSKMIGVRNTIRWKWVTGGDGEPMRQSNARMLRWSDGSVSLQLGNDLFDVAPSHGATLARPSDPKPPVPAGKANEVVPNTVSATTFLSVIEPNEQVLVTERAIAGQLSLLPTSMDSKTHLELVKHVGQQHVKHSRMKMLEETADEETLQKLLLKNAPNREMIKGKAAAANPRRSNLGGGSGSGLGRTGSGLGGSGGSKGRRSFRKSYYSDSSEEDSGAESDRGGRSSQRTRIAGRDRDRDAAGDYDEDDGFVVADSDEDEDAYGSSRKKSKKSSNKKRKTKYTDDEDDEDEELDEMEEAERRIEERERERKRAKKDSGASSKKKSRDYVDSDDDDDVAPAGGDVDAEGEEEEDMDMDVESEED